MSAISPASLRLRKVLLACVLALICLSIGFAAFHRTPWVVPPEAKERKNPLHAADVNLNAVKQLYTDNCSNCHGDSGRGDGSEAMMYDPTPSDLTDAAKMNKITDGEIYYQITEGRKPMPSFKKRLTEDQRWQMVIFVRSLAGAMGPPPPAKKPDLPPENKKPVLPSSSNQQH
jgi:mono/diheme cytochrome c family protein